MKFATLLSLIWISGIVITPAWSEVLRTAEDDLLLKTWDRAQHSLTILEPNQVQVCTAGAPDLLPTSNPALLTFGDKEGERGWLTCDQNGKPAAEVELLESVSKARLLIMNERLIIENQSEEEIRRGLLVHAEAIESSLKQADLKLPEASRKSLRELADKLKEQAATPRLKENLLASLSRYEPKILEKKEIVKWDPQWPKFRKSEYIAVGLMGATTFLTNDILRPSKPLQFGDAPGFDEKIRSLMGLSDSKTNDLISKASTVLMGGLILYPMLDAGVARARGKTDTETAVQLGLISAESFLFAGMLSNATKAAFDRNRPFVENCPPGEICGSLEDRKSFMSGHSALAFTAAGLICTSHSYLSLYDSKAADNAACLASLALASATGVMRIVSDNHYLSDVAAGTAVGLLAGFVLPRYLHFGFSDKSKKTGMTRKGILTPAYVGDDKTAAPGLACHVWF